MKTGGSINTRNLVRLLNDSYLITKLAKTELQSHAVSISRSLAIELGVALFILMITALCLFTPPMLIFKQLSDYSLYVMLGLLAIGVIFFLSNRDKLMTVSLICCSILCINLKASSNKQIRLAQVTSYPSVRVAHINLANAENEYDSVIQYVREIGSDFISFQELTPDWKEKLTKGLAADFQYVHIMTRLDQYGMGFFSKYPLLDVDTLIYKGIPALACSVEIDSQEVCHILSCHSVPPVSQTAFTTIDRHFKFLSGYLKDLSGSVIVLGDLHLPPWNSEVQRFKDNSGLQDSRRDINPRHLDGTVSLPRIPVDHIFYCNKLECTSFSEVGNASVGRVGITGTYQLHNSFAEVIQ